MAIFLVVTVLNVGPVRPSVRPIHGNSKCDVCRSYIFPSAFSTLVCYSGWSEIVPVLWAAQYTFFSSARYYQHIETSLFLDKPHDASGSTVQVCQR